LEQENDKDSGAWRTAFRAGGAVITDELKQHHLARMARRELAAAVQEYQALLLDDNASDSRRLQTLRDLIDVKKWEVNQAAGRYIFSYEEVQRISIRNRLHDFMQQNGAELAGALAPELMGIKNQPAMIKNRALDRSAAYLREALSVWLAAGNEINYSVQGNDILTAIGYRPDAP